MPVIKLSSEELGAKARGQVDRYGIERIAVLGDGGKKIAEELGIKTVELCETHASLIEAVTEQGMAGLLPTLRLDSGDPIPFDADPQLTASQAWLKTGKIAAIACVEDVESVPPVRASLLIPDSQQPVSAR